LHPTGVTFPSIDPADTARSVLKVMAFTVRQLRYACHVKMISKHAINCRILINTNEKFFQKNE
jgi:hypothetical protein